MNSPIKLSLIDFTKPWWRIIAQQKWLALIIFLLVTLRDIFITLAPFIITFVLEKANWTYFIIACIVWALAEINLIILGPLSATFQLQCIHSILYSAHQYLLTIDPTYHVKRSSGIILAKIDRAARGYEELLDQITYEFLPMAIGILTMLIILSRYSLILVLIMIICLIAMLIYGYYFALYFGKKWEKNFITSDDDFKATAFENLAQVNLVRSTFATGYMRDKLTEKVQANSATERALWLSYMFTSRSLSIMYAISILILLGFFVHEVQRNAISVPFAIGLILAYIQSTRQLIKIISSLRRYMRASSAINDLFDFMPRFGKQTIPIFTDKDKTIRIRKSYSLQALIAHDLLFNYNQAKMFNYHSLHITPDTEQKNRLYGIIGPSGTGKTTLISILGGQLKPFAGDVLIDDINIYAVGDYIRQQLIAIQGQVATNVKGTIRYNVLFGLPANNGYSDDYLINILKRVGLEPILTEHQGLDTMLGEGALNISGGQRQRLNFVGLYLRALYYKPSVILIDEPTSSLDEVSERAITSMIQELAEDTITLVIAHRLKTLQEAVGLIDLSLLPTDEEIKIYSPEKLEKVSLYYQKLLQGNDIL